MFRFSTAKYVTGWKVGMTKLEIYCVSCQKCTEIDKIAFVEGGILVSCGSCDYVYYYSSGKKDTKRDE